MVYFHDQTKFQRDAEEVFLREKKKILRIAPNADIQHVGSTAVPGSLAKGDLDIQVRVTEKDFERAKKAIAKLYKPNKGNPPTKTYASFKNDSVKVPLGVQLTVIGSKEDDFSILRDILLGDDKLSQKYNALKKRCQGKPMREYRKAKGKFFEKIIKTKNFKSLKKFAAKEQNL